MILTWLTVTTLSQTQIADFKIFTAGPFIAAQLGYSHERGSYLHIDEEEEEKEEEDHHCHTTQNEMNEKFRTLMHRLQHSELFLIDNPGLLSESSA